MKKLCFDYELGDHVQITKGGKWNGIVGIIESIRHGRWKDNQTEYETEFLVKSITGDMVGRMVLYPGDFKKVDNVFNTMGELVELLRQGYRDGCFAGALKDKVATVLKTTPKMHDNIRLSCMGGVMEYEVRTYTGFELKTREEILGCPHGIYKVFWKSGGFSLAAVGSLHDGTRWFAPTNWTGKEKAELTLEKSLDDIQSIYLLMEREAR